LEWQRGRLGGDGLVCFSLLSLWISLSVFATFSHLFPVSLFGWARADWVLDFCEDGAGKWWSYVGRADGKRTVDR
jgi:hypothetical protein